MLKGITWNTYLLAAISLTATYYLLLFFLFKGRVRLTALTQLASGGHAPLAKARWKRAASTSNNPEELAAHACLDELAAFFEEAKSTRWNREELLSSLHHLLSKYPLPLASEYRSTIARVIINQSQHYCSIHLEEDVVTGIWQDR